MNDTEYFELQNGKMVDSQKILRGGFTASWAGLAVRIKENKEITKIENNFNERAIYDLSEKRQNFT